MDYATILVHLDASRRVYQRLHLATQLAVQFQSTLVGLLAVGKPDPAAMRYLVDGDRYLASYNEWQYQVGERARHALLDATDGTAVTTKWLAPDWATAATIQAEAHLADLVVLGQHDPADEDAYAEPAFVESIVLECGRPVLVVPYAGWFPGIGKTVLVTWNGSRESARAIHDALPLLRRAETVNVVSWTSSSPLTYPWLSPPQYAAEWLARHGVTAQMLSYPVDAGEDIGQLLLSQAADRNADLIVMGAYGHSRIRELALGGVTRTLLRSMTVPVFMSH
ncbi:universal stress protein [Cupriavidus alkaliphilus]|uniref:Nucleotide-binding universal stress UspA family protein n=1 Tax=Cupriavidus alkaliphilus TaxID=942866 RepID=A0A7W4VEC2_9BURK|nr:universal stress protein [Cupriavidus alkaliphilus]MBB3010052.1 nucleotide-binding universal stress UspA family protein [Cupriavidus alkaliphilus]